MTKRWRAPWRAATGAFCAVWLCLFASLLNAGEINDDRLSASEADLFTLGYRFGPDGAPLAGPRSYSGGPVDTSFILKSSYAIKAARAALFGCVACNGREVRTPGAATGGAIDVGLISLRNDAGNEPDFERDDAAALIFAITRSADLFDLTLRRGAGDIRARFHIARDDSEKSDLDAYFGTELRNDLRARPVQWNTDAANCRFLRIMQDERLAEMRVITTPSHATRCAGALSALMLGLHPLERPTPSLLYPASGFEQISMFDHWLIGLARRLPQQATASDFDARVASGDIRYTVRPDVQAD